MSSGLHEYAFDVKVLTVVRVTAESERSAREKLTLLDSTDFGSAPRLTLRFTEATIDGTADLFEVDGVDVDEWCGDAPCDSP